MCKLLLYAYCNKKGYETKFLKSRIETKLIFSNNALYYNFILNYINILSLSMFFGVAVPQQNYHHGTIFFKTLCISSFLLLSRACVSCPLMQMATSPNILIISCIRPRIVFFARQKGRAEGNDDT